MRSLHRAPQVRRRLHPLPTLVSLLCAALLSACGGGGGSSGSSAASTSSVAGSSPDIGIQSTTATAAPTQASVGQQLFNDGSLSASGRLACASCHVANNALASAAGVFLNLGGSSLDQQALRSTPSARYLNGVPAFAIDAQGRAHGGLFWDGRADTRAEQSQGPLFNAKEMANASVADFARRLRATPYLGQLLKVASLPSSASDTQLMNAALQALSTYQATDPTFAPFTSKFDAVQDRKASFTAQEARGLAIFNDPQRGNCAQCHSSTPPPNAPAGARALFTNYAYFALALPRNQSNATADPGFFDLGLCGPSRSDLSGQTQLCGKFRVPSLRNVAQTAPYEHNGVFRSLNDVVSFYATRDVDPARWYPVVNGQVQRYNDLPSAYQANVYKGPPFRPPGQLPSMSPQDVADVVAFLQTLSDGYKPAQQAASL